jgi:alkanesulfonate monooxygenase SsuD/methylene tetrahydromethanopterin reductase-like flavin-dependent oxidoreductase (luciferase family)
MSEPRRHRTGFALRDPFPWPVMAELARLGESRGYEAVFLPEITGRDTLVTLGLLTAETERLRLATGIVPMDARSPMLTAMAAAAVQERSGGRLILGLGTGAAVPGALDRLRELIGMLRRLLAGERVVLDGRAHQLSLVPDEPVPIWVSALGPRAVRLAGELADGVLLNWCTPERVASAVAQLREGAEEADRDPADLTIAVYVRSSLGDDEDAAMRSMRVAAGEYASFPAYAAQFAVMGLGEEAAAAAAAHASGRPDEVPAALVRAVGVIGDAAAARERLNAYRESGASLPVVYPVADPADPDGSVADTLRRATPA